MYKTMSSATKVALLAISIPSLSFSCLLALPGTSGTTLTGGGLSRPLRLLADFGTSQSVPIEHDIDSGFVTDALHWVKEVPPFP